ncbi:CoA transferase [Candidatus Bathyarchaeota archaeon]|nr:MAG: CoA transferase [Candidatus Bathyarchaeota archaeon]RLI33860.1 MAG: CoA transferase [Candidatus Bathyarchaeota archaeon]
MAKILEDVRVLDLTHVYFGPYATMLLADMGAEVIKIEPPWGDETRYYPPLYGGMSAVYLFFNRNKKGMTLNLKHPKGKEIFFQLLRDSDVVVENFKPGTMERLGLGYEELKKVKSDIIYATLSGFGRTGPYSRRPSFAPIASAMSGWMVLNGRIVDPNGPPVRAAEWHGDLDPALFAVIAILAALRHRDRTGEGQMVDVAQYDCMISQTGVAITSYLMRTLAGEKEKPPTPPTALLRTFGMFKASDGYVYIAADPRMRERLLRGMGVEKLERTEELEEWVAQRTVKEVVDALVAADVPVAPVYDVSQTVEDPQTKARNMIVTLEHPTAGVVQVPNFPIKFEKTPGGVWTPAPTLGQHNEEILRNLLGYSKEEIEALRKEGVIT